MWLLRHKSGQWIVLLLMVASTTMAAILLAQQPLQPVPATVGPELAAVEALPVQLAPGAEGIALIDRQNYTICLYQYQPRRPAHERFVLVAARSFRYDCQLQDYNTADPRPTAVKELLQAPRQRPEEPRKLWAPAPSEEPEETLLPPRPKEPNQPR